MTVLITKSALQFHQDLYDKAIRIRVNINNNYEVKTLQRKQQM